MRVPGRALLGSAVAFGLIAAAGGCAHRLPQRHPGSEPPRLLVDTVRTLPAPLPAPSAHSPRTTIVRDTAYVSAVLRRCGARSLLPDRESIRDTLRAMLAEARAALARDDP